MKKIFGIFLCAAVFAVAAGCSDNNGEDTTPVTYAVTVSADDNGSVAATVGGTSITKAEEGATVTITATPKTGYEFSQWVVVSGDPSLADKNSATTTFKMPAKAVSISAKFVLTPTITYNDDADLWANTASFALANIPATATSVSVSYKIKSDTEWQDATVEGNEATIEPTWESAKNDADLTIYTIKSKTGVFAKNVYEYQLTVNETIYGPYEFTPVENGGDVIPNGDMSGWSKKPWTNGISNYNFTYPNAEGDNFWDSGNNLFLEPATGNQFPLCAEGTGEDEGTACLSSRTISFLPSIFAAGNMFTGDFNYASTTGTVSFGRSYEWTARPVALKLRYKAKVGTIDKLGSNDPDKEEYRGKTDRSRIFVAIVDWNTPHSVSSGTTAPTGMWDPAAITSVTEGAILAYGDLVITENQDEWLTVTLPIKWYGESVAKPAEDKLSLVISCAASVRGDYMTGCSTNVMYVDDFEWVY